MENNVKHFVLGQIKDNTYGWPWNELVQRYLENGYLSDKNPFNLTIRRKEYNVLKQEEVTVFYDADGNTLFDVTNERLKIEYASHSKNRKEDKENLSGIKTEAESIPGAEGETVQNPEPEETMEEKENAADMSPADLQEKAKRKLEDEAKEAKDEEFTYLVINHLIKRCEEDPGLAEDIIQEHKTWIKCFTYIRSQAKKRAEGNCAAIRSDLVYEWAEDYFRLDDKALEERKAKERKEQEAKNKAEVAKRKSGFGNQEKKTNAKKAVEVKKISEPEKKSNKPQKKKEPEGQMSLFDLL